MRKIIRLISPGICFSTCYKSIAPLLFILSLSKDAKKFKFSFVFKKIKNLVSKFINSFILNSSFDKLRMSGREKINFSWGFLLLFAPLYTQTKLDAKELPMVILTTSYNNANYYKQNLDSIFMQKYQNYRIIYIDDASTDGTLNLVADYAKENNQYHRFTFIKNKENRGSLANYYTGTYLCQDQEIVVHLDGDDWFKHEYVLQKLNNVYQGKNVWMTYGQNEEIHFDKENNKFYTAKGHCKKTGSGPVRFNAYREIAWRYTHLKTHYAGLFKHIKLKSLFDNDGRFFVSATDSAMMFSMLELSGGKFKFIDEILYVYNALNPINHKKIRKLRQIRCKSIARAKKKYNKLETEAIPTRDIPNNAKSDLIIISALGPDHTKRTLESVQCYAAGVENIYVLHQKSFKSCLEKTIKKTPNNHIILTKDNMILKDFVDVSSCIQLLEQTYAYGFYLSLGKNIKKKYTIWGNQTIPNYQKIEDNIFAWQFKLGEHDWRRPNNFLMTLYRKDDILQSLTEKNYNSVDSLEKIWNVGPFDMDDVGLFCENSKAVQVSELYKKSILALYLLQNNSITV